MTALSTYTGRASSAFLRVPEWSIYPEKTVVPGLVDCHVHTGILIDNCFIKAEDPLEACDRFSRQFIEYGVTTVRDTGDMDPNFLEQFQKGQPDWPRWFGAGPVLDGDPPGPWPWVRKVGDPASAREAVARLIDEGVDFPESVCLPNARGAANDN